MNKLDRVNGYEKWLRFFFHSNLLFLHMDTNQREVDNTLCSLFFFFFFFFFFFQRLQNLCFLFFLFLLLRRGSTVQISIPEY